MLSRVADSIYWLGRYLERAENLARVLGTEFHALLDRGGADPELAWRELLRVTGMEEAFTAHFSEFTAGALTEFLVWHPANPNAVGACVGHARENARGVREQLPSDLWERLNHLYLFVQAADRRSVIANPHAFFARIRESTQSLQGVMAATMARDEAFRFLELGQMIERADLTRRVVGVKLAGSSPPDTAAAHAVLAACGALEAFRRTGDDPLPDTVAGFLLLSLVCPRSVLFCLEAARRAVAELPATSGEPDRILGRLGAELAFWDVPAAGGRGFDELLARIEHGIADVTRAIADTYLTTRTIVTPVPQAQQQQQQRLSMSSSTGSPAPERPRRARTRNRAREIVELLI